jgi:hypothetical protein
MEGMTISIQSAPFKSIFLVIIIISIIVFWRVRSGSSFVLVERLWRLIAGKTEVSDKKLDEFIQDTRNLERFRILYGLRVETKDEMHRLIDWIKNTPIDVREVQKAGQWINANTLGFIQSPPANYLKNRGWMVMASGVILILLSGLLLSQSALLVTKRSGIWFWANETTVTGIWRGWEFGRAQCADGREKIKTDTGLADSEVVVICNGLESKDDSYKVLMKDTIKWQGYTSAPMVLIVVVFMYLTMIRYSAAEAAKRLREHLDKQKDDKNQKDRKSVSTT